MDFTPLLSIIFVAYLLWILVESSLFISLQGRLNRGVTIWHEPLSAEIISFLCQVSGNIIHEKDFIRKENEQVLIKKRVGGKVFINELGFVDLSSSNPRIEYRVSISQLIGVVALSLTIVLLPFMVFGVVINHSLYSRAITSFIQEHVQENTNTQPASNA